MALYEREINKKTKLVLVTHASNLTGQIFPARQIAAAAHRVGAEVIVDGAQTMALLDYKTRIWTATTTVHHYTNG